MAAMGQSRQENLNKCQSGDTDVRIAGCTALIQAGQETTKNLSAIYDYRGNAYSTKGDYDRAIQQYDQAIRLDPNDIVYDARGDAYKKKRDYDHAIQDFSEAIHLNPNDERAYYDRGEAYISKGDYGRAIQDYNQAIRLNSNLTNGYGNRGDAYFAQSNLTAAIADYEHTISSAPSSSAAVHRSEEHT